MCVCVTVLWIQKTGEAAIASYGWKKIEKRCRMITESVSRVFVDASNDMHRKPSEQHEL